MVEKNVKKEQAKKMRNTWGFNPTTKVKESRKKYSRHSRKNQREEGRAEISIAAGNYLYKNIQVTSP